MWANHSTPELPSFVGNKLKIQQLLSAAFKNTKGKQINILKPKCHLPKCIFCENWQYIEEGEAYLEHNQIPTMEHFCENS